MLPAWKPADFWVMRLASYRNQLLHLFEKQIAEFCDQRFPFHGEIEVD